MSGVFLKKLMDFVILVKAHKLSKSDVVVIQDIIYIPYVAQ